MDKATILAALIKELRDDLDAAVKAQRDAASYATDDESRAREKYETQSTEPSYLARGQAALAEALAEAVDYLESHREAFTSPHQKADIGSLIEVDLGGFKEWFFLAKQAGGHAVEVDGMEITLITTEAPLGTALLDKPVGESFTLPNGANGKLLTVL